MCSGEVTRGHSIWPRFYFRLRFVEGDGQSCRVNSSVPHRGEDLSQLITRIKDTYQVSESEIARRIDVRAATVNAWVNRTRGTVRGPNPDVLRRLAAAFPKISEDEVFAAAGRRRPAPLNPDAEARILEVFRDLTEEQQRISEIQMRALRESNQSAG